ncbi:MAG TPA: uracil-DNA glycosylase [Gemmatimonadaceae bacterium]|nr:uracil-DNA glycosylase [Gemmatimonadaceae bacterium]
MSDAASQLQRYLEQRRDLGESEFVLDSMSVEDALRTLGAMRSGPLKRRLVTASPVLDDTVAPALPPAPEANLSVQASELPVSEQMPEPEPERMAESVSRQPRTNTRQPSEGMDVMKKNPPGLVVGTTNANLFIDSPFASVKSLDDIAKLVDKCTLCDLYKTATHGVPGEGNPKAELVCVGEAPGANEDATGRPFVGAAGQLLTKILAAIDLKREDIFICNVLKHRPPGNRNPQPDEVKACSPYLIRQIELIKPKVILALGTFAAQTLLETKTPIGKLRGSVHRYHGVPLIVTYHPAALLRNPAWKRPTWEDVQLARRILDGASA